MSKPIAFVTGNIKKLAEVEAMLGEGFMRPLVHRNINLIEEQGSFSSIATAKCLMASRVLAMPVVIEDTCLCFNALKGMPGPYIKDFLRRLGPEGLYTMLAGFEDKTATAVCTFAFSEQWESGVKLFEGSIEGEIVSPRGSNDFGWDSCFQPLGYNLTFGEMTKEDKNKISHRAIALGKFREFINSS